MDTVFRKFDTYFGVHKYQSIKRQEFMRTKRDVPTQSIMNFISELRAKVKHCYHGDLEEGMIVNMIINKVQDFKCTGRLMELTDDQLIINNVIRVCRQVELTQAHVRALKSQNQCEKQVNHVLEQKRGRGRDGAYSRGYSRGRG